MMHWHPRQLVLGGEGQRVLDPHLRETGRQQQQQQQQQEDTMLEVASHVQRYHPATPTAATSTAQQAGHDRW